MKRMTLGAVLIMAIASAAFAQSSSVTVTQIRASGSGAPVTVDPKLAAIKNVLTKRFNFSNYAVVSQNSSQISKGNTATWALSGGKSLDVTLVDVEGEGASTRFSMTIHVYSKSGATKKTVLKVTQKVGKGKSALYGGWAVPNGTLILAVTAR